MAKKSGGTTVERVKRRLDRLVAASKERSVPAKPPGRGSPQFVLRYTPELRDRIARLAKANGRSINAELIALLERALNHGDDVEQLQTSMGEVFDRLEKLESLVSEHNERLSVRSHRDPHRD